MDIQTIGIIGYGAFGRLAETLIKRFSKRIQVKVWRRNGDKHLANSTSLQGVASCDAVILAVPIRNYEEVLEMLRPHLRADTILVDIATVKGYTQELMESKFSVQPRLNIHPMFGPASFRRTKGNVRGFPIIVTGNTLGSKNYRALKSFTRACGFKIIQMTAKDHDKSISETLFIAHLQSQTLNRAEFLGKTSFDTPSVRVMKEAAEMVVNDTDLFTDVVLYNPFCRQAMIKWQSAQSFIWELLTVAK